MKVKEVKSSGVVPPVKRRQAPVSGKKNQLPLDNKIAILQFIKERKEILMGQFSTDLENSTKMEAWEEVREKAQSLGACTAERDWKWVRDTLFGTWKSQCLAKRDNRKQTGSKGGKSRQPDKSDELLFDIIGKESPVLNGLDLPDSGQITTTATINEDSDSDSPNPVDYLTKTSTTTRAHVGRTEGKAVALMKVRKVRLQSNDTVNEKRGLQVELLKMELYKKKLEILKLEMELGLPRGEFTKEFLVVSQDELFTV